MEKQLTNEINEIIEKHLPKNAGETLCNRLDFLTELESQNKELKCSLEAYQKTINDLSEKPENSKN